MFTPWLGFKGGKGVATAVGAFAAIAPRAVLVSLALFIVALAITFATYRWAAFWGRPLSPSRAGGWCLRCATPSLCLWSAIASLLIIIRHHANIQRLVAGTENRLW